MTHRQAGRSNRKGRQRPAVVRIRGLVEQGQPTLVRSVRFQNLDIVGAPILDLFRRTADVQVGDRLELEAIEATRDGIVQRLQEQSFAFASVRIKADIYPDQHLADVSFVADTGPTCRFGQVTVTGNVAVPGALIQDEILVHEGDAYKASTLSRTRQRLFGLGTFSIVDVKPGEPEHLDSKTPNVPIDIQVSESRFKQLKTGVGMGMESGAQELHVSAGFRHTNLAHKLLQLELNASLGYASTAGFGSLLSESIGFNSSPVMDLSAKFTYPRFLGRRWRMVQDISFVEDLESSYRYASSTYSPSFTYQASKWLSLTTSYYLQYFVFLDQDIDLSSLEDSQLGLDISSSYFLSYVEQKLVWDGRDDVLFTHRGLYGKLTLATAGGPWAGETGLPFMGDFNFVKAFGDLRLYNSLSRVLKLHGSFVLATRLAGGVAEPFGIDSRASVPFAERFYLGGGTTVRGWVSDHLGPLCKTDDDVGSFQLQVEQELGACSETLPLGGRYTLFGSVELRKSLLWGMGVVAFLDFGQAWDRLSDFSLLPLLPSAGSGIRYASPVGPVRLDFGFRLDQNEYFANEPRWNAHFSLSEAF